MAAFGHWQWQVDALLGQQADLGAGAGSTGSCYLSVGATFLNVTPACMTPAHGSTDHPYNSGLDTGSPSKRSFLRQGPVRLHEALSGVHNPCPLSASSTYRF